jgi:hypothetical protein
LGYEDKPKRRSINDKLISSRNTPSLFTRLGFDLAHSRSRRVNNRHSILPFAAINARLMSGTARLCALPSRPPLPLNPLPPRAAKTAGG